jgi:YD repeat-containing protein
LTGGITAVETTGSGISTQRYDFKFDSYGNIIQMQMPAPVSNGGTRATRNYEYDNILHQLNTSVSNNLNYISSANYDCKYQVPLSTTDIGGAVIRYTYDTKGRVASVKSPKDPDFTVRYKYWDMTPKNGSSPCSDNIYIPNLINRMQPKWVLTEHYNEGSEENIYVLACAGGFGQIIAIDKTAPDRNISPAITAGYKLYDGMGQAVAELTEPIENGFGAIMKLNFYKYIVENLNNDIHFRTYKYDNFGRVIEVKEPDGTITQMNYDIANDAGNTKRFKTSTTNALGNTAEIYKDVRGLTMQNVSPRGVTTNFYYSGLGQLLQTQDPEQHLTEYQYDRLGRTEWISHPSRGTTYYTYDGATASVKKERNPLGDIEYSYDILGRPTEVHYGYNPQNDVYYQYGAANSGLQTGKLVKLQDATGVTEFEYGDMGEVTAQVRMHILPNANRLTHRTEWRYDSWGRTRSIKYPDGEKVEYLYNLAGLLQQMQGNQQYITNIQYNKMEQKTQVDYGNNTRAEYRYDPVMQRLTDYDLYNENSLLMHKDYMYDDIGNIETLNSHYSDARIDVDETYGYDADNQLVGAQGNGSSMANYGLDMKYSLAGRITRKNLTGTRIDNGNTSLINFVNNYKYNDPNNPYAVTRLDGTESNDMVWDAAGNLCFQVGDDGTKFFTWTEDNRMQGFYHDNGNIAALYRYDAGGERDLKMVASMQDIDINGHHY